LCFCAVAGIAGTLPQLTASIPLGCLSVRQALVQATSSRVATAQDYQQLQQAAQGILDAHSSQLAHIRSALATQQQQAAQEQEQQGVCPAGVVIATGGTVTTLAALQQQLEQYEHNAVHMSVLHKHQIQQLLQQYLYADAHRMDYQPSWLTAVRGAALSPGCAGLLVLMDWLGADKVVVSDSDLLDGAVAELLQQYELQHDQ
jgi:exopolyphosphatase/pppGpp-phosphohydrolase